MHINKVNVVLLSEGKLKKLKGSTKKEPLAKDILIGLDKLRECQMHSVVNDKDSPYISNSEYDSDNIEPVSLLNLQRKLAPEKQAINNEEIKPLIDNDVLSQIHQSLFSDLQLNEQEKTG